ncbi:MAG: conjugal transfer protein TraG N-terminal domain-containing protein [Candidatus Paceibacterota bacterium]|jgi:hypothetical protein
MDVGSSIEIYTLVLGWLLYDGLWQLLSDTGVAYIPLVAAIVRNFTSAWRSYGNDGADASLRANWLDVTAIMVVLAVAGAPLLPVRTGTVSTLAACGQPAVTGANTGTLYDNAFVALDGRTAQVPLWWYAMLKLANGFNNGFISLVPCSPDLRTLAYKLDNVRIADPELRRELELFNTDCWQQARAKFNADMASLPAAYPPDDITWIGSQFFQDSNGYYGNTNLNLAIRASVEIPGFPYDAARDTEYLPGFIPANGRPECKDWWVNGLQPRLLALVDTDVLAQASADTGSSQSAQNALVRTLLTPEQAALGRKLEISSFQNNFTGDPGTFARGTAGAGLSLELATFAPKIYALRQAAPIGQSLVLMGIYTLLPFVLLFAGYAIETLFTVTVALLGVKFLTALWTLAVWLDNHMLEGLGIHWYSWVSYQDDKANTVLILNLVALLLFVVLPFVWFVVLGFAVRGIGGALEAYNKIGDPIAKGAENGGKEAISLGKRSIGKILK